ncbi:diacylglycerol/lipid kinase family protein [Mycolicibacter arupensis]|uniref:DeoR faimly transcriptional regulator n=1 Tax=Mycolicibacter arupensis TaxID=342002 RepID=A0A0F5MY30_9MYCO|nr:diacylglycerol kinase family protein [Mycolicibacter arupensis]KKB99693.1 DeoR faimly transcriptional regulator [Mycolicibacter arupensis]MCV7276212.1 diacylglycerol kinase family lipid kinase [Mycolicibacter arupensis]ORA01076.1 diacylglycerol kinase [Mycolicibacter arupensis]TXI55879.1 MAG: diacylglycerol kinase family lipid kinase [Mycolicibacter arupensis]
MRAVLIVNPNATSTTPAGRDLLAHALKSRLELTVVHTDYHGHASEIGQAACRDGVDLVIAHGGDGTVHGVVNGMLGKPGSVPPANLPAVAVVPGGSANVFARSLGIAADPIAATNQLIELINPPGGPVWRRIGLIDCGERWSVLNAGMGVDGEVVAAVEAEREKGHVVTPLRYIRAAVPAVLASTRRPPTLTLRVGDDPPIEGVHLVFVSNCAPWTYADDRSVWTNPDTTFESGMGVFATTSMKVLPTLRLVRQMLSKRPKLRAKQLIRDDDVAILRVDAGDTPIATQIDGEYLGTRTTMTFRAVPDALSVVAPPANKSR